MRFEDRKTQVLDLIEKNKNLKEMLFGNDGKGPLKKLINSCIKLGFNPLALNKTGQDTLLSLLTVRNAYEILEHQDLLPFIEEKNIDLPLEKIRDSLNNGSYQALHRLVKKSPALCHSIYNIEDQSLADNGKETLQRLKQDINLLITNLTLKNDYNALDNFLLLISENFLPKEKLIDSLNNGSYEVLCKLVESNLSLREHVSGMEVEDQVSLNEKGQEILKQLQQYIQHIQQNLVVSQQDHREISEIYREISEEQFQKMIAEEAKQEAAAISDPLLQQLIRDEQEEQRSSRSRHFSRPIGSMYFPRSPFDFFPQQNSLSSSVVDSTFNSFRGQNRNR